MTKEEFVQARKLLGLTQKEIAQKLGVAWRTVQNYEAATHGIPGPVERLVQQWLDELPPGHEAPKSKRGGYRPRPLGSNAKDTTGL